MGIFDAISDREWEEYSESPEQAASSKSITEAAEKLKNAAKQAGKRIDTIIKTLRIAAKLAKETKENREEAKAAGEGVGTKAWPDSKELFTNWKTDWDTDKNTVENRTAFRNWFTSLYDKVEVEADKHRDLNFQKKSRFLILVHLCTVVVVSAILGYCIVCGVSKSLVFKPDVFLALMGSVSLLSLLYLYPFAKWIDVKKYQETWARHRAQLDRMQIAMVKFLYVTPPQGAPDRYQQFVIDILKTEEDTMESFQKMLQTQEKAIFSESLFGMK